jgi:DNA-binding LacI/PurR family transcriptional regulator
MFSFSPRPTRTSRPWTVSKDVELPVFCIREAPNNSANVIGPVDVNVGILATEHLISMVCQPIAHIRSRRTAGAQASGHLEGYLKPGTGKISAWLCYRRPRG